MGENGTTGISLPFMVYAAREGYGWVSTGGVPLPLREQFRRAAGKMTDYDVGSMAGSSGVVNVEEWALIYRFMCQVAGDSKGRDCAYLAMTCIKLNDANAINIDSLLLEHAFKTPQPNPPDKIEYAGGHGSKSTWMIPVRSASGLFDSRGSLSAAGPAVGGVKDGTLKIHRTEPDDGEGSKYEFTKTQVREPEKTKLEIQAYMHSKVTDKHNKAVKECPWRTAVLLFIWAFLLGVLIGRGVWP